MEQKIKIEKKYLRYGLYIVLLGFFLVLGYKIADNGTNILAVIQQHFSNFLAVISPIFSGFILAYLLFRPVVFLQKMFANIYEKITKKRVNESGQKSFRILSIVIMFAVIVMIIKMIIGVILPPIIDNIEILINNLPHYQDKFTVWIEKAVEILNKNNIDISNSGELVNQVRDKVFLLSNGALDFITESISQIGAWFFHLVLTLIFTFYFIKDKETLFDNFKYFRDVVIPGKVGRALTIFMQDLDEIVGKFLVAEMLDSVIVGVVSTILLLISGHPFAILIGCVAGITNFIPYVGPIIGAALAFGLGIFSSLSTGVIGAALLLLYQQVDGNFVQPKIVGDKIGLTPIWILIVVLIGGSYFGAIGMILSMPIGGLIRIYFIRYAEYKKKKRAMKSSNELESTL